MKNKDALRLVVLRSFSAALKNEEIAQKKRDEGLNDDESIAVIARQIKQRRDSILQFQKGGREDLAKKEEQELAILQSFMPAQMSEDEIREVAREVIASGASTFGAIMSAVIQKVKVTADGETVRKIVEESLRVVTD